jgi:hypothetical protein
VVIDTARQNLSFPPGRVKAMEIDAHEIGVWPGLMMVDKSLYEVR